MCLSINSRSPFSELGEYVEVVLYASSSTIFSSSSYTAIPSGDFRNSTARWVVAYFFASFIGTVLLSVTSSTFYYALLGVK